MDKLAAKIRAFNPNDLGQQDSNIFGLPFGVEESRAVIVPVPWEVTVSYGAGTASAPAAILEASRQVDLYDPYFPDAWKIGVAMDRIPAALHRKSNALRKKAERYIDSLSAGPQSLAMERIRDDANKGCADMVKHVRDTTSGFLAKDKLVALVGGDHSTPLGFLQALASRHRKFGILQIDAHADLRDAYEGFTYSHASIMFNALKIPQVSRLVQVGIRDYCEEEVHAIKDSRGRVRTWFDRAIKRAVMHGEKIAALHRKMAAQLPRDVYVSFDIDGLDPKLCPHTGTPVPGGFEFEEAVQLIQAVADSGRRIIGFDINEVGPREDEWDANVGSRLLFRMINIMAKSRGIRV